MKPLLPSAPIGLTVLALLLLVAFAPAFAQRGREAGPSAPSDLQDRPARFAVTADVINPALKPFTATIGAFGNSMLRSGGAFEPQVWRCSYNALQNSPDQVVLGPAITRWDTLREGFLDGAEVRVYRIENGRFRLVRTDHVVEGGSAMSGWQGGGDQVIAPETTRYVWKWDGWNRPEVPYYFTVKAVDQQGNESRPADPVAVIRPAEIDPKAEARNPMVRLRVPREPTDTTPPPAPGKLTATLQDNGTVLLTWDAVDAEDLAGYRIYRSDYAPEEHRGFHLQLSNRPGNPDQFVREGDLIFVSKTFYTSSRQAHHSHRVWDARQANRETRPGLIGFYPDEDPDRTWALDKHDDDTPVEDAGETYLTMTLGEGVEEALSAYSYAGTEQGWYEVMHPQPYKVEVWLRRRGEGDQPVRFDLTGHYDGKIEPIEFQPTTQWQKFEATFTPPEVQASSRPGQIRLRFTGPGTFDIDNFRVYRADTAYLDYAPEYYEQLAASGMFSLRTHGPIKTGTTTYDMWQYTNPAGVIRGVRLGNTLGQTLAMMHKANMTPWLQIEMHMSPDEWRGFVEFIAAPYDPDVDTPQSKPWAHKRYAQGQAEPWTEVFDQIYFEISNETWNWLFRPWIFESMTDQATGERLDRGAVYGLFQEHVREAMRASPYWQAAGLDDKVVFVLGGWSGQRYGREAAAASPNSDLLTIAAYNGGWDEGEGPASTSTPSYFNVLAQVNQTAIPRADRHLGELIALNDARDKPLELGTYEAGPGYALNGLNGARVSREQARQQELVMKSMAAGTATLDSFLARSYRGFVVQNFFTYSEGRTWSSHAEWYHGGQGFPQWKTLALFNREALGDMLVTRTLETPTVDLPRHRRRAQVDDAPLAAAYATRRGDRVNVFVISRRIPDYPVEGDDGFTPVTLELPFTRVESITLHRMVGDPRAHNLHRDEVKIERVELPTSVFTTPFPVNADTGADARGLPPAATLLYVFDGVDMPEGERVMPQPPAEE